MARIPKSALTWQKQFTPNFDMSGCTNVVNQAIAQWFISDPEKLKTITQCSFYLDSECKILTIDCPECALEPMKMLSGEMGQSVLDLGVILIRLTCEAKLISQFSPDHAIYVQRLHQSNHQKADTE